MLVLGVVVGTLWKYMFLGVQNGVAGWSVLVLHVRQRVVSGVARNAVSFPLAAY
jgi:hypothetical protein